MSGQTKYQKFTTTYIYTKIYKAFQNIVNLTVTRRYKPVPIKGEAWGLLQWTQIYPPVPPPLKLLRGSFLH